MIQWEPEISWTHWIRDFKRYCRSFSFVITSTTKIKYCFNVVFLIPQFSGSNYIHQSTNWSTFSNAVMIIICVLINLLRNYKKNQLMTLLEEPPLKNIFLWTPHTIFKTIIGKYHSWLNFNKTPTAVWLYEEKNHVTTGRLV